MNTNSEIKIDFHGSTHGHFLEFITNVFIFKVPHGNFDIFLESTGACHKKHSSYLNNRIILCGHFSSKTHSGELFDHDSVIRIAFDKNDDKSFFIALTNLMFRAGDIDFEEKLLNIPEEIRNDSVALRNNWYSKLNERELYVSYYSEFENKGNLIYEFPFESFYNFTQLCKHLSKLATILGRRLHFDKNLYFLWQNFIRKNQGWNSFQKCDTILNNIFSGKSCFIDSCTVLEEAWINYNLSKICNVYDGEIFFSKVYPTNTQAIHDQIQKQIQSYN